MGLTQPHSVRPISPSGEAEYSRPFSTNVLYAALAYTGPTVLLTLYYARSSAVNLHTASSIVM